jgi:DNA-binding response OmpR family regulator
MFATRNLSMKNGTPHVIVCDDDAELNAFIRNYFKLDGFVTHQALSAEECIDKLSEMGDTIDAITANGKIASDRSIMLILNVKRLNKKAKIFVLADKALSEAKTRIMDYGADEFMTKPLSIETLVSKVNSALIQVAQQYDDGII